MKVHEYQAKEVLAQFGVPQTAGIAAHSVEDAVAAARELEKGGTTLWVVKAQIHAGGRGKGGGVKLAKSVEEVKEIAEKMFGMMLITHQTGPEGQKVRRLLITDGVDIETEFYVGITLDRARGQNVIMASTEGGVEIEKVAEETPDLIKKVWIDPELGLRPFQAGRVAYSLGLEGKQARQAAGVVSALYKAYEGTDATLMEINPLVVTKDGQVLALDAKINFDDNALFKHPAIAEMHDPDEQAPLEVEANTYGLNYIKLDGNVGCMVNGAGLAMATMDIIKIAGGEPANFLDVGGGANAQTVEAGFKIILKDPNVKAILVNIFGGIVRCDRVASGIVEAAKNVDITVPLIVRLQGTNAEEGAKILEDSGVKLQSAVLLEDAAEKVTNALSS